MHQCSQCRGWSGDCERVFGILWCASCQRHRAEGRQESEAAYRVAALGADDGRQGWVRPRVAAPGTLGGVRYMDDAGQIIGAGGGVLRHDGPGAVCAEGGTLYYTTRSRCLVKPDRSVWALCACGATIGEVTGTAEDDWPARCDGCLVAAFGTATVRYTVGMQAQLARFRARYGRDGD